MDDAGLSTLPHFPALAELMPMDVPDEGYRHIGKCAGIESLVLMYCHETTDRATEHITGMPRLKKYFASYTRITGPVTRNGCSRAYLRPSSRPDQMRGSSGRYMHVE